MVLAAGAAGLWRFLTPRRVPGKSRIVEVALSDIPSAGALVMPGRRMAVVRESESLQAFDLTCTHLGCVVTATSSGFACPCHGSRFDVRGRCHTGPATRSLRELHAEMSQGAIAVSMPEEG